MDSLRGEGLAAMQRARARLVTDHPFFGDLALRLILKADTSCRDLWTDGRYMGFNPAYAATLLPQKLIGAQAHEVLHLAFGHHLHRRGRDKRLWNQACDIAINELLLESGFTLPDGFVRDQRHAGKSADEIYEILARELIEDAKKKGQQKPKLPEAGKESVQKGPLPEGGTPLGAGDQSESGGRGDGRKDKTGTGAGEGARASDEHGSGKGKKARTPHFDGEVRDLPEADGDEETESLRAAEQEAQINLTRALNRARHMGSLPAGLSRLVRKVLPPELDWRDILRQFLDSCADSDYSWTTPNRRYLYQDIYMPSRREQRLPHIAMAVDSSGSVDEATLAVFCSELLCVLDSYDTTLTVLFHDTKVQKVQTFTRMDAPSILVPAGGGGTDFRPIPEAIRGQGVEPACLIWFTDLECTRFPEEPDYPVLWVCPGVGGETPPFGDVLRLYK